MKASGLIAELETFANEFKDDEEDPSLLEKIKKASTNNMMREDQIDEL